MSRENVEIVRRLYEAGGRGDADPFEFYAPEIEWDIGPRRSRAGGLQRVYRGHEGVHQFWRDFLEGWEGLDFRVEDLIDADDQVLAVVHERVVGPTSGIALEGRFYAVWTLRDGKVVQMRAFEERSEALEAAGLSE